MQCFNLSEQFILFFKNISYNFSDILTHYLMFIGIVTVINTSTLIFNINKIDKGIKSSKI